MIQKKSEISSERADAQNSRGPLCEGTRDSERSEQELGTRGPQGEVTPGLVDNKGTVGEGDSSKLATGGTSGAMPGTGEIGTSNNSSERAAGRRGDSATVGESSNVAGNSVSDVPVTVKEERECEATEETRLSKSGEKKLKSEDTHNCEMANGTAKKLKSSSDEGEAPVQQNSDLEELELGDIVNADSSETGEEDENETAISDRQLERGRLAVVPEGYPDVKMTEEQAEVVETALVESINPSDWGQPIQFLETQYENGALVFTCANKKTHMWLQKTVQKMVPWPGARLELGHPESILKGVKFIVWVNHKMGVSKRSYQQILELIQKQNKDISTTEWRVIRGVAETLRNERLVLWVDNRSSEDLKARNYKLFLGLDQVKFMKMSEWKKKNSSSPADKNLPRPTTNYKRHHPSTSKLLYDNFPPHLLPGLASQPMYRYRGPGLSPQNPRPLFNRFEHRDWPQHRDFAFVDTGRHLRGTLFTDVVPSGERTYTNHESRFPDSQQPRLRFFSAAERSRESSYVHRQPRYMQKRGYSASNRRQSRDTF